MFRYMMEQRQMKHTEFVIDEGALDAKNGRESNPGDIEKWKDDNVDRKNISQIFIIKMVKKQDQKGKILLPGQKEPVQPVVIFSAAARGC